MMWGRSQARSLLGGRRHGSGSFMPLCPKAHRSAPHNLRLGMQAGGVTIVIELPLEEQIPDTCMQPPLPVNLSEYFISNSTQFDSKQYSGQVAWGQSFKPISQFVKAPSSDLTKFSPAWTWGPAPKPGLSFFLKNNAYVAN